MGRRGTNKRGLGGGNPKPPPGAFPIKKGRWPDGKKGDGNKMKIKSKYKTNKIKENYRKI